MLGQAQLVLQRRTLRGQGMRKGLQSLMLSLKGCPYFHSHCTLSVYSAKMAGHCVEGPCGARGIFKSTASRGQHAASSQHVVACGPSGQCFSQGCWDVEIQVFPFFFFFLLSSCSSYSHSKPEALRATWPQQAVFRELVKPHKDGQLWGGKTQWPSPPAWYKYRNGEKFNCKGLTTRTGCRTFHKTHGLVKLRWVLAGADPDFLSYHNPQRNKKM